MNPQMKSGRALATQELARRELARRKLVQFATAMHPNYKPGWVHHEIAGALEQFYRDIEAGKSPRLAISVPPRHGKSQLASIDFPAWLLGQNPKLEVVVASYAANLAVEMAKKSREILRSPLYHDLFKGTKLHPDMQAVDAWKTTELGGYVAVGVEGGLTGKGADCLILDDVLRDRAEAESEARRRAVVDWFTSTAMTRLMPGAGVLLIMTRWHEDDLAGWIQRNMKHENWRHISYPAIAEEDEPNRRAGDPLHPERYDLEALERIRATIGARDWNALYQQNPMPAAGTIIKVDYFKHYTPETRPALDDLALYVAWDLAVTRNATSDYTVGTLAGIDREQNIYILEVVRGRFTPMEIVDNILDLHTRHKARITGIEQGQISFTLEPFLNKRMAERNEYIAIERLRPGRANKVARAMSIIARMQQGKVLFPTQAPWLAEFESELLRFPNGKHDDMVDSLAYLGIMMETMIGLPAHRPPPKPTWKDKLQAYLRPATGTESHMSA